MEPPGELLSRRQVCRLDRRECVRSYVADGQRNPPISRPYGPGVSSACSLERDQTYRASRIRRLVWKSAGRPGRLDRQRARKPHVISLVSADWLFILERAAVSPSRQSYASQRLQELCRTEQQRPWKRRDCGPFGHYNDRLASHYLDVGNIHLSGEVNINDFEQCHENIKCFLDLFVPDLDPHSYHRSQQHNSEHNKHVRSDWRGRNPRVPSSISHHSNLRGLDCGVLSLQKSEKFCLALAPEPSEEGDCEIKQRCHWKGNPSSIL